MKNKNIADYNATTNFSNLMFVCTGIDYKSALQDNYGSINKKNITQKDLRSKRGGFVIPSGF